MYLASSQDAESSKKSSSKNEFTWHHGTLSRELAGQRLLTSSLYQDGLFFLYEHESKPGSTVLALVFKGNPTHHLLKLENGSITINNKLYFENNGSIIDVITRLATDPVPSWPQRLITFLPHPEAATVDIDRDKAKLRNREW